MNNLIRTNFDRYRIIEQIGEGGMAVVYKAHDSRLDRDVAIKIIRSEAFPPEQLERILKRFEREAKALGRLTHTNIVKVYDYGDFQGAPYLVMEYLPGGTLKEKMGRPFPWQTAARLLIPVARALKYAHENGILHRDVKPSNILLTSSQEPMLSDFGIAKILESEETQTLTGTGVGIGTPEYMSPEQGIGKTIDVRADIYSLGVVFYELVTGRKPFTDDTPMAIILKQVSEPLPSPRQFVSNLPEQVERVLRKALAKQPDDRYPDMGEFIKALESFSGVSTMDTGSTMLQPDENTTQDTLTQSSAVFPAPPPEPGQRSYMQTSGDKWLLVGMGALVCLGLAGGAFYLLQKNINPAKPGISTGNPTLPTSSVLATSLPSSTALAATPAFTQEPPPTATLPSNSPPESSRVSKIDGMKMLLVPGGTFTMGDSADTAQSECLKASRDCPYDWFTDEAPGHKVRLDSYYIDKTEVTNQMYALCVNAGVCKSPDSNSSSTRSNYFGDPQYADYPVIYVTWDDAKSYCSWANRRLPTEAEWEKAARGTDQRIYPWGNSRPSCSNANYYRINIGACKGDTAAVGSYTANVSPYGAQDMAGNVWEWVTDWYSDAYYGSSPSPNPTGPAIGVNRLMRGGAWSFYENVLRSTNRHGNVHDYSDNALGFRCVQDVNP